MTSVGTDATRLIVLRGNSASGKTTTAREVRLRCGRKIAIVSQDVIRRDMLREKDVAGGVNVSLIDVIVRHSLNQGYHVILEGIFSVDHYGEMLASLVREHCGQTSAFYFDVPFDETVRRHATKPQSGEYGAQEMQAWYRPLDLAPGLNECRIDASISLEDAVDLVITRSGLARQNHVHDAWNR